MVTTEGHCCTSKSQDRFQTVAVERNVLFVHAGVLPIFSQEQYGYVGWESRWQMVVDLSLAWLDGEIMEHLCWKPYHRKSMLETLSPKIYVGNLITENLCWKPLFEPPIIRVCSIFLSHQPFPGTLRWLGMWNQMTTDHPIIKHDQLWIVKESW